MPKPVASSSSPNALVSSALPSASIITLPSAPWSLPQAAMTKASLTDMHTIKSTPFAVMASALFTKLGRCFAEQVGVNAPGTANKPTFLPANSCVVLCGFGPSALISTSVASGILSPTWIVIVSPLYCMPAPEICRHGFGGEITYRK